MKILIVTVDVHDDKAKQKAMKTVCGLTGIDSISMDMKERKMTVVGDIDPVQVVSKLRKSWPHTNIVSVGAVKEPEKKKDEGKKDGGEKKKDPNDQIKELVDLYKAYNPYMTMYYHNVHSAEENPNACVIL